jgi:CubicO group peptidase (beta-lactamase class C family)
MYLPPIGSSKLWKRVKPVEVCRSPRALTEAVAHAEAHEIGWPRDLTDVEVSQDTPPYNRKLGPMKARGGPAGLVLHDGGIVAEWGDIDRVDVTFSVTKSYLAALMGIALDRGLIASVDDAVSRSTKDPIFHTPHNAGIAWRHLLQQTSEMEGTLWGIPDTVDWNRKVEGVSAAPRRERKHPGEHWEYNDVRVNALALALLRAWNEPLPEALKRELMDPIGATSTWSWHGYGEHSTVELDGRHVESVSGGAHWGGGLWISTCDHARFGLLFLNDGRWGEQHIVSKSWIDEMTKPCEFNPQYGYLWWLNTGHTRYGMHTSSAAFAAAGAGGNCVLVEPDKRLVIVIRWCDDVAGVIDRVTAAFA